MSNAASAQPVTACLLLYRCPLEGCQVQPQCAHLCCKAFSPLSVATIAVKVPVHARNLALASLRIGSRNTLHHNQAKSAISKYTNAYTTETEAQLQIAADHARRGRTTSGIYAL